MSMKLTNDIQQLQLQNEQLQHHIVNMRQVVDNLTGVVQRIEKEAAEDRELVKELIKTTGAFALSKVTGPTHGRGKKAI